MKTFSCDACGQVLYFENSCCTQCGATLAFLPDEGTLTAVVEDGSGALRRPNDERSYRHCANRVSHEACNWVVATEDDSPLCKACRLNEVVPDLTEPRRLELWRSMEKAKRRLLYTLNDLGVLRFDGPQEDAPRFRFMADMPGPRGKILTGHASGVITINIAEADSSHRERVREELRERYRTLLGHFRHESGHFFWDRLVAANPVRLEEFRQVFGDERADYAAALERHYERVAETCPDGFVSVYATMHPWEDWAETWAHYLHMVDTLQTSAEYGLTLWTQPRPGNAKERIRTVDPKRGEFDHLISAWMALTVAMNSLSRSMGTSDAYPFALSAGATKKIRWVHDLLQSQSSSAENASPDAREPCPHAPPTIRPQGDDPAE